MRLKRKSEVFKCWREEYLKMQIDVWSKRQPRQDAVSFSVYVQITIRSFLFLGWQNHNLQDNGLCMTFSDVHPQRTPHLTASLPLLLHTFQKCLRPCLLRPSHAQFIRHCETVVQIYIVKQQPKLSTLSLTSFI